MRRLPIITPTVPLIAMLMMPAVLPADDSVTLQTNPDNRQNGSATAAPLLGKWIVRSVQHDAHPTVAQIGRKVGDIIKFARGADGNIRLT